jgi:hypothetical protein
LRFAPPQPGRTIGLAWRHTSPLKVDFVALGQIVTETLGLDKAPAGQTHRNIAGRGRRRWVMIRSITMITHESA